MGAESRLDCCSTCFNDVHVDYNQEEVVYIHDRLFVFVANGAIAATMQTFQTMGIYTLFNLALVHHLSGRLSGDEYMLISAKTIYRQVMTGCKGHTKEALLKCLALNGLADLYHQMGNCKTSVLCLNSVFQIAAKTHCLRDDPDISHAKAEAMLLNKLLVQFPTAAKAA
jgi:hypothetical protein